MISFAVQKILIRSHLFIFVFMYSRKWVIKDVAVIYVKEGSTCVLLQEYSSFWFLHLDL